MTRAHHPAEEGVGLDPDPWWTHGFPAVCVTGRQSWLSKSRPDSSPEIVSATSRVVRNKEPPISVPLKSPAR